MHNFLLLEISTQFDIRLFKINLGLLNKVTHKMTDNEHLMFQCVYNINRKKVKYQHTKYNTSC